MIISIDLGGTKILTVLLDSNLSPIDKDKLPTPLTTNGDEIVQTMVDSLNKVLRRQSLSTSTIDGIAVSVPSPVNAKEGIVLSATNIGFTDYPLRKRLSKKTGLPVYLENDVNAGLYGEFRSGAGRGRQNIVGLYPGTGIGGALILNGQLYRGASGGAAELGHIIIQAGGATCGCGSQGCLESLASKTALAKDLVHLAAIGKAPSILRSAGTDYTKIKSSHILKSILEGEEAVSDLVHRASKYLGIGMASCVNIFNPELIVLGGGLVEKLGDIMLKPAVKCMQKHAMKHLLKDVEVRIAELGDETVIIGAALLFYEAKKTGA